MNSLTIYCGQTGLLVTRAQTAVHFAGESFSSTSGRYSAKPLPTLKGFYPLPLLPHLVPNTAE